MSITPYKILHDFFSATNVSVKVALAPESDVIRLELSCWKGTPRKFGSERMLPNPKLSVFQTEICEFPYFRQIFRVAVCLLIIVLDNSD